MEIEIQFIHFNELSYRKDVKKPSWFAVDNDILNHPDFFNINGDEMKVYIWLCCVASKVNSAQIRIDPKVCAHQCLVPYDSVLSTIEKLDRKRILIMDDNVRVQICTDLRRPLRKSVLYGRNGTDGTDGTNETDGTDATGLQGGDDVAEKPTAALVIISTRGSKALPRGCIPQFQFCPICVERMQNVTYRAQESWLVAYPNVDWIVNEIRRAHAWAETNSKRAPKDWGKFMLSWLSRGYENYRKSHQSVPTNRVQAGNDELRRKIEAGEL